MAAGVRFSRRLFCVFDVRGWFAMFCIELALPLQVVVLQVFATAKIMSDVVWIMSDIIFPT